MSISSVDSRSNVVDHLTLDLPEKASVVPEKQIEQLKTLREIAVKVFAVVKQILSTLLDIFLLPFALVYLAVTQLAKKRFDPEDVKKDKAPLLLLHGSGYNETEWIVGRQFLKDAQFGSVFSLNYDGLFSNDPEKGIDDYAAGKVREKIQQITELTGQKEVNIVGHSMGGLVAACYAEEFAEKDNIAVKKIITIGTPWQGSPAIDVVEKLRVLPKKLTQMKIDNVFLKALAAKALKSEGEGVRKYYTIGSETDFMVPSSFSALTDDQNSRFTSSYLGHYGLIVSPEIWKQVQSWLSK